jgi:hypothetical protein
MTDALPAELALIDGVAQLLAGAGVGTYGGVDGPAYGDDIAWPITLGRLIPDRAGIAVNGPTSDAPVDDSSTRYGFQVMLRTPSKAYVSALMVGRIRNALHGRRQPPMPPGIRCTSIQLQTHVALGRVGAFDQHSLNFTALCARASSWSAGAAY